MQPVWGEKSVRNNEVRTLKKKMKWIYILAASLLASALTIFLLAAWVYFSLSTGPKILYYSSHDVVWDVGACFW